MHIAVYKNYHHVGDLITAGPASGTNRGKKPLPTGGLGKTIWPGGRLLLLPRFCNPQCRRRRLRRLLPRCSLRGGPAKQRGGGGGVDVGGILGLAGAGKRDASMEMALEAGRGAPGVPTPRRLRARGSPPGTSSPPVFWYYTLRPRRRFETAPFRSDCNRLIWVFLMTGYIFRSFGGNFLSYLKKKTNDIF